MNKLLQAVNDNDTFLEQEHRCYQALSSVINIQAIANWYNTSNDITERNEVFDALKRRDPELLSWKVIEVLESYPTSVSDYVIDIWCDNLADGCLYDENNVDILN